MFGSVWSVIHRLQVDFIEAIDSNRDGLVDYKEYMDMVKDPNEEEEEEKEGESRRVLPPKVSTPLTLGVGLVIFTTTSPPRCKSAL